MSGSAKSQIPWNLPTKALPKPELTYRVSQQVVRRPSHPRQLSHLAWELSEGVLWLGTEDKGVCSSVLAPRASAHAVCNAHKSQRQHNSRGGTFKSLP